MTFRKDQSIVVRVIRMVDIEPKGSSEEEPLRQFSRRHGGGWVSGARLGGGDQAVVPDQLGYLFKMFDLV